MTTNKDNIENLKNKINYINSYGFENLANIYNKKTVKALEPDLKSLKEKIIHLLSSVNKYLG